MLCCTAPHPCDQPLAHCTAGHYAVASGDPAAAAVRFVAVTHISPGANQARLAAVSAALALLATQHPDDIPKAAQILRQCEVFGTPDAKLPFAERSACPNTVSLCFGVSGCCSIPGRCLTCACPLGPMDSQECSCAHVFEPEVALCNLLLLISPSISRCRDLVMTA